MRAKLGILIFLLASTLGSAQLLAQSTEPPNAPPPSILVDCAVLNDDGSSNNDIAACSSSLLNRQSLINTSTSIRNIIIDRMDAGPDQVEPAGIALDSEQDVRDRLGATGNTTIIPTADDAGSSTVSPLWNVWVDGKYSWLDDRSAIGSMDGSLVNLIVGADYKVSDRLVIGLMGTVETSDLEGLGVLSQETDGWGGGAYLGMSLTDNVVFSANILGASLDTGINGVSNVFDSDRIQASSALTGYWYSGTWRYSPSLSVAWSKEWQDAILGFNAQTIETAIISPGIQIGNTVSIGGANTVEPWLGAQLDAVALNKVVDAGLGTVLDDPYTDLRLQGGLNLAFAGSAQLALTAEVSGILVDTSNTYTFGANFAFQF